MKNLIITAACIGLLFASCLKKQVDEDLPQYSITGYLYKDCSGIPIPNALLELTDPKVYHLPHDKLSVFTRTDANGFYTLTYPRYNGAGLRFYWQPDSVFGVVTLLDYIPVNENLNLDLYHRFVDTLDLHLSFNQPHTAADTLYLYVKGGGYPSFLTGPFTDTTIQSIPITSMWGGNDPSYNSKQIAIIYWGIGHTDYAASVNSDILPPINPYHVQYDTLERCQPNEGTLVID